MCLFLKQSVFIYFCAVSLSLHGLFCSCGGRSLAVVCGPLTVTASPVAEHKLQASGL